MQQELTVEEDSEEALVLYKLKSSEGVAQTVGWCRRCGWRRQVTSDREQQQKKYNHLAYGHVSVIAAAEADVRSHDCERTAIARRKVPVRSRG